jgi:hypothetical protein
MDPGLDRVSSTGLHEGIEVLRTKAHELADFEVADTTLEHEAPNEGLAHSEVGGSSADIE